MQQLEASLQSMLLQPPPQHVQAQLQVNPPPGFAVNAAATAQVDKTACCTNNAVSLMFADINVRF